MLLTVVGMYNSMYLPKLQKIGKQKILILSSDKNIEDDK